MSDERDVKAHNRSVRDDKPRTKLSKEMQDFIVWVSKQDLFRYNGITDKWESESYTDKSTLQLLIHFQKNVYKP